MFKYYRQIKRNAGGTACPRRTAQPVGQFHCARDCSYSGGAEPTKNPNQMSGRVIVCASGATVMPDHLCMVFNAKPIRCTQSNTHVNFAIPQPIQ